MELTSFLLIFFTVQQTATADLSPLYDSCCSMGRTWFQRRRESCPPHVPAVSEVALDDIEFCKSVIHVCCLEPLKEKLCDNGIRTAKTRNSCDSLNNRVDMEDSRECCNCCNMGIIAAKRGLSCSIPQMINQRCENNFLHCCNYSTTSTTQAPLRRVCESINPCHHMCLDEPTGARCACRDGFSLDVDGKSCRDVNECLQSGVCSEHETCENTLGSYHCRRSLVIESPLYEENTCALGFALNQNTNRCEDVNECALSRDNCMAGQTCENTIGSYQCLRSMSCGTGYTLDQRTQTCMDDNECSLGTHNCGPAWDCINLPGSFRCVQKACPHGSRLNSRTGSCDQILCSIGMRPDHLGNCADIDECIEVQNACRINQECRNSIGSFTCHDLLNCGAGYIANERRNECEDINECDNSMHECTGHLMQCVNLPGSYACQCPTGFRINHNLKTCEDVDECRMTSDVCALNARCENTHGSYRCQCREGFEMVGNVCRDIDECLRQGMCHHTCRNTWGSFRCECREGFQVASDTRMCEDIDECMQAAENSIKLCLGICENTHGSFVCSCPQGYRLSADMRTCEDIDECLLNTARCSHPNELCINTRGGYKCQIGTCPDRFIKSVSENPVGVKCQRIDYMCPQGDHDCVYAPISVSINFLSFPTQIRVPTAFFHMKGPQNPSRRLVFSLEVIKAEDPITGESRVHRGYFNLETEGTNEAFIHLLQRIEGPQDVELELKMTIYSKEFQAGNQEQYYGTAVAKIFLFITKDPW